MVSVNGEHRDSNINIWVLIIDVVERPISISAISNRPGPLDKTKVPLEDLASIAEKLKFTWLISKAVHPEGPHDLIHGFS